MLHQEHQTLVTKVFNKWPVSKLHFIQGFKKIHVLKIYETLLMLITLHKEQDKIRNKRMGINHSFLNWRQVQKRFMKRIIFEWDFEGQIEACQVGKGRINVQCKPNNITLCLRWSGYFSHICQINFYHFLYVYTWDLDKNADSD